MLTTAGLLMEIVKCQIRGLVFHKIHHVEREATGWIDMLWGETDKKTNDLKARQIVARDVDTYV